MLIGIDVIENDRFARALERHPRLKERVFTDSEREYCNARPNPVQHFAARFAAKEAVGKALGTGVRCWRDIEISSGGKPRVSMNGRMKDEAARIQAGEMAISISHGKQVSVAVAVAGQGGRPQGG